MLFTPKCLVVKPIHHAQCDTIFGPSMLHVWGHSSRIKTIKSLHNSISSPGCWSMFVIKDHPLHRLWESWVALALLTFNCKSLNISVLPLCKNIFIFFYFPTLLRPLAFQTQYYPLGRDAPTLPPSDHTPTITFSRYEVLVICCLQSVNSISPVFQMNF